MHTPYFPALRSRLAALGRHTAKELRQGTLAQFHHHLGNFLPPGLLAAEDQGPNSRVRAFPLRLTVECFLWQILNPQTSCREVVRHVQALCRLQGRAPIAEGDSAYVQARQRVPRELLEKALRATAQAARTRTARAEILQGRPVKGVDGSTTQMADTPKNQQRYPQPSMQHQGCGFPVVKLVVLFCLASGAIIEVLMANLHNHELRLFHGLWDRLKKGDILLGDRGFGEFSTLAGLPQRGVDVIARLHQKRRVDFRKAKRLGRGDGLFTWAKGCQQSSILNTQEWKALPSEITVRLIRFTAVIRGRRNRKITLVTTLLDPQLYPTQEIIAVYARRWRLELCLRDLKTTLGMEALRCKSPDMVEKELLAYLIAHNLVRCIMAEAARSHELNLERVSFKGTLDAVRQYSAVLAQAPNHKVRRQLWKDLLLNLARDLVPDRPNRQEPRALKRRPKQFPLLNKPRHKFKEMPHRNRYWKNKPRDLRSLN